MSKSNVKRTVEDLDFDCVVCMERFEESNTIFLSNCEHVIHTHCMKDYLKAEMENQKCSLVCFTPNCKKELSYKDLNKLLTKAEIDKFH